MLLRVGEEGREACYFVSKYLGIFQIALLLISNLIPL
jgi:hypothetical protein